MDFTFIVKSIFNLSILLIFLKNSGKLQMPNKSKYFSTKKYMYFYLGKNTDALFAYTFGSLCRFVWRQLELCVFRALVSTDALFLFFGNIL